MNITEETINIETLKRLEELSKTKPKLITAYITQLNCLSYVELSLSGLLQTVEGLYKNTSLINEYGKKRNMGIYQHVYERNSTNLILNKDDRITTVVETNNKEKIEVSQFVRYMVDIRNFYTHYNEKNNSKLVGETYLYIFLKVSIASRIVLFEEILGRTDIRLIEHSVRNIDLYAPYKGLRYDQ